MVGQKILLDIRWNEAVDFAVKEKRKLWREWNMAKIGKGGSLFGG